MGNIWQITSDFDGNDFFSVEAENEKEAYLQALTELGWNPSGPYDKEEYHEGEKEIKKKGRKPWREIQ